MIGITAVAMFAVAMIGDEVVLYKPISKLGGASAFTASPQRFASIDSIGTDILFDDDSALLWDDDSAILWDE